MSTLADSHYFPREQLVDAVHHALGSGLTHAITMFAARRMGKTLFVKNDLMPAAEAWGWRACYIDLWVKRDHPEVALVEELEAAARPRGLLAKAIKPDKVTAKAGYAGSGLHAEWTAARTGADLQGRLRVAMQRLVQSESQPLLLILGEFQTLAKGEHEDLVAAFRATMLELQPRLKIFFTGSSRDALNEMFRKRKAPLFDAALSLTLPNLGIDFVENRAVVFKQMTGRDVDVAALAEVFQRIAHVPLYMNQIILHMVVGLTADPWDGLERWRQEMGETGLREQWLSLKPVDRIILQHLAKRRPESLFGAEFSASVTDQMIEKSACTPQRIHTAVNRLVKQLVLAPTGVKGEYEIEDRALATYLACEPAAALVAGRCPALRGS